MLLSHNEVYDYIRGILEKEDLLMEAEIGKLGINEVELFQHLEMHYNILLWEDFNDTIADLIAEVVSSVNLDKTS